MNRLVLISGLMLFSLFFGAGNLIFPPMLGHQAGVDMWPAMAGFIVTGVLLPLLAVIVVAYFDEGVERMGRPVHPVFGMVFAVLVYLSIGALYGIPRAANVAYEVGTANLLPVHDASTLIGFSVVFFLIVFMVALNPAKIVDNIGKYLTPILLIAITLLSLFAVSRPETPLQPAQGGYGSAPVVSGILEGYFTMDLIGALAFSMVIISGLKYSGVTDRRGIVSHVLKAGMLSSVLLIVIYLALAYIGGTTARDGYENGTDILTYSSMRLFGSSGDLIFSAIVVVACLTTCIGLVNACSAFGARHYSRIPYKVYVFVFTAAGFLFTTLGLNTILSLAAPLLAFLYPVSIVLVMVSFLNIFIHFEMKHAYVLPVVTTIPISILEIIHTNGLLEMEAISTMYMTLPLSEVSLGWLLPFAAMTMIGLAVDWRRANLIDAREHQTVY
ncbi:branched-chain amino acid transport system II carrier protein [Salinicoccus roseus]|uniref:branched-chain amino acid transport system II carrier protein n=1 Tax=Salinicoccus roseus TaxID=45670 RepID=UPI001EF5A2F2|nr:branched-chain amino acid transport system II carrier protein [Salinicoccus roseus]MCG7332004.1 branched-chain amino acid transport system II carrier protein [Salinicoccus roseus]